MSDTTDFYDRLASVLGVKTDVAMAKALGMSPQSFANARKRGTIPYEKVCDLADERGLSLDYLLLGKGSEKTDRGTRHIDLDVYGEVIEALLAPENDLRALNSQLFSQMAAEVYNAAISVSSPQERKLVIAGAIRLINLSVLKKHLQHAEQGDVGDEFKHGLTRVLQERIAELEDAEAKTGREGSGASISQEIRGRGHQIAGRDVVNKGPKK